MRKWMRERLQRRKKKVEEQATQPAEAPLQPAYFDSDEKPAEPQATVREPAAEESQAETVPAQQDRAVAGEVAGRRLSSPIRLRCPYPKAFGPSRTAFEIIWPG